MTTFLYKWSNDFIFKGNQRHIGFERREKVIYIYEVTI